MTRLINAALISLFAFFVFLGVFLQFSGDGQGTPAAGMPTVTGVDGQWQTDDEGELLVELQVHNPSSLASRVAAISYVAEVDGKTIDRAVARPFIPPVAVPGKADVPVRFAIDLPDGFILTWWPEYLAGGEQADLRIQGVLTLRRDDASRDAPFEWRSSWQGTLLDQVSSASSTCTPDEAQVCLDDGGFLWEDGALQADLGFHNPGEDPVTIRNLTVAVLFGGRSVMSGAAGALDVPAQGDAQLALVLPLSRNALATWWPEHLERCERTPVALLVDLEVHGGPDGNDVTTMEWSLPASTFQTRFLCAP